MIDLVYFVKVTTKGYLLMKYKWLPVFDIKNCTGCRACISYCASGSLTIEEGIVSFKNPEACLSDEFCVRECPMNGIYMAWLPISDSVTLGKIADQKPSMSHSSSHHSGT